MPEPRVRFTTRRMMASVVVVALGLGFWVQIARTSAYYRKVSHEYLWLCKMHEGQARAYDRLASQLRTSKTAPARCYTDWSLLMFEPKVPLTFPRRNEPLAGKPRRFDSDPAKDVVVLETFAARALVRASYFERLERKYHAAASRPWIPVGADEPPPP